MNANKLWIKIIEAGITIGVALEIYELLCDPEKLTIGDALLLKELLNLTNLEAIDIFLS